MKRTLVVLLAALTTASAVAQQNKADTAMVQSIRVEKGKPEKKSGKWIAGRFVPSSVQAYDNAGNLVGSIVYMDSADIYVKYAAKYSDAERKLEDIYFNSKGAIQRRTVYQYDASRRLIGKVYFDSTNASVGESTVHYKAGRINELVDYDTKGTVIARTVYTYYVDERKVEKRHYGLAGFSGGEILAFDEQGRLKESNSYELDVAAGNRSLYQYDKDGNITELALNIGEETVTWRYSYDFDAHGNWVTQTITPMSERPSAPNPKPIDITKRTILYGVGDDKPKRSTAWSLAQYVASDVAEFVLNGPVLKRNVPSSLLSSLRLNGQAKVFVLINEFGRVILAIPYGRLHATVATISANNVRNILENTIKDWKYMPTVLDGESHPVTGIINFNFSGR
jgi:antitoxin component YwqK of YwqJK toxin-antitoxin module